MDEITIDDVTNASTETLTPAQVAATEKRLGEATAKLRLLCRRHGVDIDAAALADPDVAEIARGAVVAALLRVAHNGKGLRQFSQSSTEGPWSATDGGTFDNATSTGALYIDPGDLTGVLPDTGETVGSIRIAAGLA